MIVPEEEESPLDMEVFVHDYIDVNVQESPPQDGDNVSIRNSNLSIQRAQWPIQIFM